MIYRNDPYLDAQFQKAVQAAHNQDWGIPLSILRSMMLE